MEDDDEEEEEDGAAAGCVLLCCGRGGGEEVGWGRGLRELGAEDGFQTGVGPATMGRGERGATRGAFTDNVADSGIAFERGVISRVMGALPYIVRFRSRSGGNSGL